MTHKNNYLSGWGGAWQSEALPSALPIGQNSPQSPPYGLYAEQLSGSAFTRPRTHNLRSWLYRILPSVSHSAFEPISQPILNLEEKSSAQPTQFRWNPLPEPSAPTDFIQGLKAFLYTDAPQSHQGCAVYLYSANTSMETSFFYNSDGELLFVPFEGECELNTEFGPLTLSVGEIAVIPRGVKFQVLLHSKVIKGYVCENYGQPFTLPDLGPIGSNGLANPQDFYIPCAKYEDKQGAFELITKSNNRFWKARLEHSPLDVVAWRGNYAPYKYPLDRFNTINTVSVDHCDPSIFTVLTSPGIHSGIANIDFVIFPERWMVAEHTFRPPYYHRNIMSEYMGLIYGEYDAKADSFLPGGGSLHNCMSAHGPDAKTTKAAIESPLNPVKQTDTLAFMFETSLPWIPTPFALSRELLQGDYQTCWEGIERRFDRDWQPPTE